MITTVKNINLSLTVALLLTFNLINAQAYDWARTFSATNPVGSTGGKVKTDASANSYLFGRFISTLDLDPSIASFTLNCSTAGNYNPYISKYTILGAFVQAIQLRTTNNTSVCEIKDMVIDASQNIYVTGIFDGSVDFDSAPTNTILTSNATSKDVFIAKYNGNGSLNWVQQIGGINDDFGNSIAIDPTTNSILVTGAFSGTAIDFNSGVGTSTLTSNGYDGFILKLNASTGNFSNVIKFGNAGNDSGAMIKVDASGNIYAGGTFASAAAFSGISFSGGLDVFYAKYNSLLSLTWAKGIGGPNDDLLTGLEIDGAGNVYSCGNFKQSADFNPSIAVLTFTSSSNLDEDGYILKADMNGDLVWASQIGGTGRCFPRAIGIDGASNVFISGDFTGSCDFDPSSTLAYYQVNGAVNSTIDVFIQKLSSSGNYIQTHRIGGTDNDINGGVAVNSTGGYIVSGNINPNTTSPYGTTFLDNSAPTNTVSGNFYLAKYSACAYPSLPVNSTSAASQTICSGNTATLSTNASTNTTNWFNTYTATVAVGNNASYVTPALNNSVTYFATRSNTCGTTGRVPINVTVNTCTGINENIANESYVAIYPNPSNGIVNITSNLSITKITIADALGKEVEFIKPSDLKNENAELNLKHLNNGIYFITVFGDEGVQIQKIIIDK
jgi:hypothetical protein